MIKDVMARVSRVLY